MVGLSEMADFEVVRELGRGSSSVVELAWQRSLQRPVALKRLQRVFSGDAGAEARLRREAQVIARLADPRVVTLYRMVVDRTDVVLVMEYVRGPTVGALCKAARPAPSQVLAVVADVAAALDHAARHGVVHRDVKPANVFVTADGRCKLGDFGLARMSAERAMFLSTDGARRGTPLYMAPEQLRGEELGPASDVYALALVAWELFAGAHPLSGLSVSEVVSAHLAGTPATMPVPALPEPMAEVLRTAVGPAPEGRPSASELAAALTRLAPAAWFEDRGRRPEAALPVAPDGGLWGADAGWTKEQVADSTWVGPEEESPAAGPPARPAPDPTPVVIDDSWVRLPDGPVRLGTRRRRRRWPAVVGAFVVGFAVVVLIVTALR